MQRWLAKHLTGLTLLLYATSGLGLTVIGDGCIPTDAAARAHFAHSPQAVPHPCPPPLPDGADTCRGQCLDVQPRLVSQAAPHRAPRTGLSPLILADLPRDLSAGVPRHQEPRLRSREPREPGPLMAQRHLDTVVLIV